MKRLSRGVQGDGSSVTPILAHDERHLQRQLETPNGLDENGCMPLSALE